MKPNPDNRIYQHMRNWLSVGFPQFLPALEYAVSL